MSSETATRLLKVGLIGPGSIARERLLPALKTIEGVSFWSVLGRDQTRAAEFATAHGAEHSFTNVDKFLLDPELDAVIIASPDKLHAEQCLAAAKAGKHIFVEKPMATTHEDALAIVESCRSAAVKLAVGYHLRFHQGHRLVSELIAAGRIGKIRHMNISWTMLANDSDWRAHDQMARWWSLAALGTHALDLAIWLMPAENGKVVESRAVCTSTMFGGPHDETAMVSLAFESGATAQVLSSVIFKAPRVVEIFGSDGHIRCVDTLGPRGAGKIFLNDAELAFQTVDPYKCELSDFIKAIRDGSSPAVDGSVGAGNVALLESLQV